MAPENPGRDKPIPVRELGRVAVLYGGQSAEREISLNSGREVLAGLRGAGVDCFGLDVQARWLQELIDLRVDRVFVALHGAGGEDGTVQGALECLGIPYTGSGVLASALAMDKLRCKQLWRGLSLPSADFEVLNAGTDWSAVLAELGGEVMVKPATEGSSLGMARASSPAQLREAWQNAQTFDRSVIAERWLSGPEYTVAILGQRALPAIKLETERAFYDYAAKYLRDDTRYICPCGLDSEAEASLADLALRAFNSLGCAGWGRVDLMLDGSGQAAVLEVNTVPGMTDHSLVPMAAAAAGLSFSELVVEILSFSTGGRA